jgi:hypothetical protein
MEFQLKLVSISSCLFPRKKANECFPANRVTTMHDFGYVALNMKYVNPEDSGTYTCRAINELGQAVTSASLIVHCKSHQSVL